jgi:hypothetical protein
VDGHHTTRHDPGPPLVDVAQSGGVSVGAVHVQQVDVSRDELVCFLTELTHVRHAVAHADVREVVHESDVVLLAFGGLAFPLSGSSIVAGMRIDRVHRCGVGRSRSEDHRRLALEAADLDDRAVWGDFRCEIPQAARLRWSEPTLHLVDVNLNGLVAAHGWFRSDIGDAGFENIPFLTKRRSVDRRTGKSQRDVTMEMIQTAAAPSHSDAAAAR